MIQDEIGRKGEAAGNRKLTEGVDLWRIWNPVDLCKIVVATTRSSFVTKTGI